MIFDRPGGHVGAGMSERSKNRKTLFVRNLPYSTRDAELEKVFGHYGQIKSCFTVKKKGNRMHSSTLHHSYVNSVAR